MTTPLKILIIGPGYPYRNGQSIYLSSLCNQLSNEFKVELINYSLLYPKFLFPGTTQYDTSKDRKVSFPNKRLINSLNPVSWWTTAKYINRQNPDLIAIDWWHPFFGFCYRGITTLLSKRNKRRIVFITENVISHEANKMDKVLTRIGLKNATCFLALSEAVEKHLKTFFNKPVFRSALPIYDFYQATGQLEDARSAKVKFGFDESDVVLLFFGLVRKYKGLDLLIKAFDLLRDKNPDVRLMIVGEFYDEAKDYEMLIAELGLQNKVYLENKYIPDEEVGEYLNACDCVVLPYRSATQSGILSIAYGARKPVVVTDVGELGSLVRPNETGVIAPIAEVNSIQKALIQFLELQKADVPFKENIESYVNRQDEFKQVNDVFYKMLAFLDSKNNKGDIQ